MDRGREEEKERTVHITSRFRALRKGVQQVLFRERYTSPKPTGQDNKSVAGIQKRNLHVSDVLMALGRSVKHKWSFVGNSEDSQCLG